MVEGLALVELDDDGVATAFRADVLAGLAQPQKAVPARWLYDDAGSELFEKITALPEYYPTRAETEILSGRCAEFRELIGPGRAVVEFGSGSSVKTPLLLGCIDPAAYVPLDISGDFLRAAAQDLAAKFPGLPVHPVEADFMREVALPAAVSDLPKLGFFPGSTIGNMVARTAVDLLRSMRATLGPGSQLLIGMDLIKDVAVLEAAYDDAEGVTAAFNLNLLERANRELGTRFVLDQFAHSAFYNAPQQRIEMHLVSRCRQQVALGEECFEFEEGETLHTENSHKFTIEGLRSLAEQAGFRAGPVWTDAHSLFSVHWLNAP